MISFFKKSENGNERKLPVWVLLIGAAVGLALILLGGGADKEEPEEVPQTELAESELIRYQEYLETRVASLCQSMGVGTVSAIVTLEGGFEEVYATEWVDGNEEYVIVGKGSSSDALYLSRNAPEIMGIGVVCHASLSADRKNELIALIGATFHTPTNRIYITAAK